MDDPLPFIIANRRSVFDLDNERYSAPTSKSYKPPKVYFRDLRIDFRSKLEEAVDACEVDSETRWIICQAAGLTPRQRPYGSLMSHRGMRKNAGRLLYQELRPLFAQPGRNWFFGTFITDVGNALEYATVVEAGRLKRDVWKMLNLIDMHAVGVVELQLARYPLRGSGRTIQAHAHTLGYSDDPDFCAEAAQKVIARRATLSNWLGAPVSVFKPFLTAAELQFWSQYIFKAPLQECHLRRDAYKASGFVTHPIGTVNQWGALRLTEILSNLTLREATLARGGLVKPKGDWIRAVNAWTDRHPAREEFDYGAAFRHLWDRSPTRQHRANPIIRHDARLPPDQRWITAMDDLFLEVEANRARFEQRRCNLI